MGWGTAALDDVLGDDVDDGHLLPVLTVTNGDRACLTGSENCRQEQRPADAHEGKQLQHFVGDSFLVKDACRVLATPTFTWH